MSEPVLLEAREVRVAYDAREILKRPSLQAAEGELIGLVGPNGAGKSTLLRVLAGLLWPSDGSVFLDGRPMAELSRRERSRLIGYVPQDVRIDFPLTAEQVVLLGRHPHSRRLSTDSAHDYALAALALERVGMAAYRDRKVSTLSGGERQLVMLARALCGEPRVLLLDEPVSALDLKHQLLALAIVRETVDEGAAGVVVLHDLNLASRFCDRVLVMHQGQIKAAGSPSEVLRPSLLREAYGVGVAVRHDDLIGRPSVVAVRHRHSKPVAVTGTEATLPRALGALFRTGCIDVVVLAPAGSAAALFAGELGLRVHDPSSALPPDLAGLTVIAVGEQAMHLPAGAGPVMRVDGPDALLELLDTVHNRPAESSVDASTGAASDFGRAILHPKLDHSEVTR
ncbi:ABC transporter ATP-binding protein [Tepidiforma thermophila]|uniref:Iron complex transport system ATP-binding protein n=1 Tax=Tepidiforma thermophila (strain KCTC 52669 / CGMCC 1.13589 / G233) TaxID=2761530 RepID=A0A2A9HEC8_TEPT2|nr:ABC transporter ATP-binding protein [Tepidiforma thermophila]PFG74354.1 iron complex transport system ATP-binding protein [Tepidiforma thermophila]